MGYVTVTETEYVGDTSKTTSLTFECFEDFLIYDELIKKALQTETTEEEVDGGWRMNTGKQPVGGGIRVEVLFADGVKTSGTADFWEWDFDQGLGTIIKYRIVGENE